MRDRQRTVSEQEGEQRRRETADLTKKKGESCDSRGFTKAQVKAKIKSLEKWKRKNGNLSEADQKLLLELSSQEQKQRVEEKQKKDLDQSKLQQWMFEEAVKNVGADISAVEHSSVFETVKEDEKVETQAKPAKRTKTPTGKTSAVVNRNKSLRTELIFPMVDKGSEVEEGSSSKPSVQDSLDKIKLRNEMRKKTSLESAKSNKTKQQQSKSDTAQLETKLKKEKTKLEKESLPEKVITKVEKKGKVKKRGKKKKATEEDEEEEDDKNVKDVEFDYNQVVPIEVEAGTVDYFAPLLLKRENRQSETKRETPTKPISKVKTNITGKVGKSRSKKKEEYLERNSHRFIKGDYQLMAFAEDYLHIKELEDAESKFRRLNL